MAHNERRCGDCQLCCRLLPMKAGSDRKLRAETITKLIELGMLDAETRVMHDFNKPAGERCPHQRHGKGCMVYSQRPFGCRFWNCRWLVNDDTADLSRPDRSHYVIDISPDFVKLNGEAVPVIQVWIDPQYPNAHRDPKLRAYLERRGHEGYAALIRLNSCDAFALFPPSLTRAGWVEQRGATRETAHTAAEKVAVLGEYKITIRQCEQ